MGKQILIVEDNLLNMELATDILESAGYDILQASDEARPLISQKGNPQI